jgi:hypothetical protein
MLEHSFSSPALCGQRSFTDRQLCERWQCSKMTLWRMRQRGDLNSWKRGSINMTSDAEVERIEALGTRPSLAGEARAAA